LQHIGADISHLGGKRFGAGQRLEAPADQQMVPACAILLGQGMRAPSGPGRAFWRDA
jgi:hypothetical protein